MRDQYSTCFLNDWINGRYCQIETQYRMSSTIYCRLQFSYNSVELLIQLYTIDSIIWPRWNSRQLIVHSYCPNNVFDVVFCVAVNPYSRIKFTAYISTASSRNYQISAKWQVIYRRSILEFSPDKSDMIKMIWWQSSVTFEDNSEL